MEGIQETLERVSLGNAHADPPALMSERMILCASKHTIKRVASTFTSYIVDELPTFTEDERIRHILGHLFRDDRMVRDNARTVVSIVKELLTLLGEHRAILAEDLLTFILNKAITTFEDTWKENSGNGSPDLSSLYYHSWLVSDFYALQLLEPFDFLLTFDRVAALVSGPALTKIFIYEVMSRALTGNAPKLPAHKWYLTRMKWLSLVGEDRTIDVSGRTRKNITMFINDARLSRVSCALPYVVGTSDELEAMCQSIVADIVGRRLEAKSEKHRMDWEQEALVRRLGAVSLH